MHSIKQKTITGIIWSFIDNFSSLGITFIVGIILARRLSPAEFGLIGIIAVFIAISESFINSGFTQALIRKKDCTDIDYSTVFFFNLVVGIIFYIILFLSADSISIFFNESQLTFLIKILGLVLIIDSFTIIQRTILTKRVDFKLQTKISIIASITSGIIGISFAYLGYGVLSLVIKTLSQRTINSLLLWAWNRWRPVLVFSIESFRTLFSFGSKLLLSGLIDTIYRNIYYLVIGKYFSSSELGYYTRAQNFSDLPSQNINGIISRVSYPVLSQMQDDPVKLKKGYKRLIKITMFVTFILMAIMAAIAEPLVLILIGENWRASIAYLQLLCFVGMMYPLHSLNLNMLNVLGRSDLFLRLEIIKKLIAIPTIIIGIFFGIKIMILGMWINTLISYYLNSYYSGVKIKYSIKEQLLDILPSFLLSLFIGMLVFLIGWLTPGSYITKLIIQLIASATLVLGLSEVFKISDYLEIKNIIKPKLISIYHARE